YSDYIANTSMATAVDVTACQNAIVRLANDATLRKQLGENGRQRARSTYDWSVVVRQYEELWTELAELRAAGPARFAPKAKTGNPLMPDPFELHAHYPTRVIAGTDRVLLGAGQALFESLSNSLMMRYGSDYRASSELCARLLQALRAGEELTVSQVLESHPNEPRQALLRSLGHLAKFDVIQLEGAEP
ncbi:MAG TPA: hypothetical protein VEQ59_25135, partial [Polyangiaceae bacterium]|nr:hypothetical protein [Polyangiaceae bacterium]